MTETQGEQIIALRKRGMGYKRISCIVNLSRDSVRSYCKTRGLTGYAGGDTDLGKQMKTGNACKFCGQKVEKKSTGRPKKFCCENCRRKYWKIHRSEIKRSNKATYIRSCAYCHQVFESYGNKGRKYCCHEHYILNRFYVE